MRPMSRFPSWSGWLARCAPLRAYPAVASHGLPTGTTLVEERFRLGVVADCGEPRGRFDAEAELVMPRVILIVDDEPLILELTSAMATDLGCEVQTADCARDALAKLAADPRIALLLTDVQMPGMSGYELAEKAQQRWPDLRVVVMSGNDLGGKGYTLVRKPFSQPQLERILGSVT